MERLVMRAHSTIQNGKIGPVASWIVLVGIMAATILVYSFIYRIINCLELLISGFRRARHFRASHPEAEDPDRPARSSFMNIPLTKLRNVHLRRGNAVAENDSAPDQRAINAGSAAALHPTTTNVVRGDSSDSSRTETVMTDLEVPAKVKEIV